MPSRKTTASTAAASTGGRAARPRYAVLRDTREKEGHGWEFPASASCAGTSPATLDAGDYTLAGYEHLLRVERKGAVAELAANLTQAEKWACFRAELERLGAYPAAFVVMEFTLEDVAAYPAGLPWAVRRKVRVSPGFYLKRLLEVQLAYRGVSFVPAGRLGKEYASSLFKRVVERWPTPRPG
jgi:hypothetical protein